LEGKRMKKFRLQNSEFIELNNLLKVVGLCESGGMAKAFIAEGLVNVNGKVELRKRYKTRKGDIVELQGHKIIVE
jgi:ribosome-associated protein